MRAQLRAVHARSGRLRAADQLRQARHRSIGPRLGCGQDLAVGSGIGSLPCEKRALKGLPGEWELFAVDKPTALRTDEEAGAEPWADRLSVTDRIEVWWARRFPGTIRAAMRISQGRG